ncbi:MAG: hypothetical protein OXE05_10790 [Chloroflexi bacterium]|nr:hypothetical protein [Chloroflexota bacterium]
MSDDRSLSSPEEAQRQQDDALEAASTIDETPEGFPICQWCGGAITEKEDLVVAVDDMGAPTQIAPVGYTAPRTYAAFHRECHIEFSEEPPPEQDADTAGFWTPVNLLIVGVSVIAILIVLAFAVLPQ